MIYQSGDRVKTKVLQNGDQADVWVTATVTGVNGNGDSSSYNLAVDKQWHDRFASEALRVPPDLIERIETDEQKSLISMIVFPNAKKAKAQSPKAKTQAPIVATDSKYTVGQQVQTRIVYGRKDSDAKWIEAEIVKYNGEDDSWDLKVLKPKQHKVLKSAVHVPDIHVRKMPVENFPNLPQELVPTPMADVKKEDIDTVVSKGHAPRIAKLALQLSSGNLMFAETLLDASRGCANEGAINRGGVLHIQVLNVESTKPMSCVYMKLDGDVKVTDVVKQTNKAAFNTLMTWSDYSPSPSLTIELWQHNQFWSNKCVGRKQVIEFADLLQKSVDNTRSLKVDMMDKKKVVGFVELKVLVQKTGLARVIL